MLTCTGTGAGPYTTIMLCTTFALNVVGTICIVTRLLLFRRRFVFNGRRYTQILEIMAESASLYTISVFCILVAFVADVVIGSAMILSLTHIQVCLYIHIQYHDIGLAVVLDHCRQSHRC